jgi:D-lactate dehydrogenase
MKIAVYSTKPYDKQFLDAANQHGFIFTYFEVHLNIQTIELAKGHDVVCIFVNDIADKAVLQKLSELSVKFIALRCAGFNNVDLPACKQLGIAVVRVPAYSPYSVAEHTVALILSLNRKIPRAYNRIKENNFSLEGLIGFDLNGKTIGIIGVGKIGKITAKILQAFGTKILYYDLKNDDDCDKLGMKYSSLDTIFAEADIISLHCPLTPQTKYIINKESIGKMKDGVMLVNTSRGALIDTKAVIKGLKSKKIGYLALDVYEEEGDLFFEDMSDDLNTDDIFSRLVTFPNVLITGHQAFFTKEAMQGIANVTMENLLQIERKEKLVNEL